MKILPIPGHPGYGVTADGVVWSQKRGPWKTLTQTVALHGRSKIPYLRVRLSDSTGRQRWYRVHTLVLLTFRGKPKPGQQGRHVDGNSLNNRSENLRWGTSKKNHADMVRHRRKPSGEGNGNARLSTAEVLEIRRRARKGASLHSLARNFATTRPNVRQIVKGKTWKDVTTGKH